MTSRGGAPVLARWTTDWDCGYETEWWYVIKDKPFDISKLKSKRRYEINKGIKNFGVREINPADYSEEIYKVTIAAYETYPKAYKPHIAHDNFVTEVKKWGYYKVYGAFSTRDESLCGYLCLLKYASHIDFCVMKAIPAKEKYGLNAAMVNKMLVDHETYLIGNGYICDGSRSILHETAFQDYLEKYFDFRKAYCKLHIRYSPKFTKVIKVAYRFRKIITKVNYLPFIKKLAALIKMEELRRESLLNE